jgi:hypothetical protein
MDNAKLIAESIANLEFDDVWGDDPEKDSCGLCGCRRKEKHEPNPTCPKVALIKALHAALSSPVASAQVPGDCNGCGAKEGEYHLTGCVNAATPS